MPIPLKDIVDKWPEKRYYDESKYSGKIEINKGYNQALSDVSNLPIEKDKVLGMVGFDVEKLTEIMWNLEKRLGFPPAYQTIAKSIISHKSEILTIKGDV